MLTKDFKPGWILYKLILKLKAEKNSSTVSGEVVQMWREGVDVCTSWVELGEQLIEGGSLVAGDLVLSGSEYAQLSTVVCLIFYLAYMHRFQIDNSFIYLGQVIKQFTGEGVGDETVFGQGTVRIEGPDHV